MFPKRGVVLMRNRRLNDAFFCFFLRRSMRCCSTNAFLCTVSPDIFVLLCRRGTCAAGTAIGRVFDFGLTVFFERSLGISLSLRGDAKPLFLHASRRDEENKKKDERKRRDGTRLRAKVRQPSAAIGGYRRLPMADESEVL